MKRRSIRENGLVGTLFSDECPSSSVIVLGGSSGGLHETRAENLAKEGFAALALAYFGVETLPTRLHQIPLEYFEKAIEILSGFSKKIGLWGVSRGAELSLILGTLFPEKISAIAAHVPSSVVYGALDDRNSPAWIYGGKPIAPSAPFVYTESETGDSESTAIRGTPLFLNAMKEQAAFDSSAICVEKIKCPLLLISAEDDQMWPSSVFARQIVSRLNKHGSTIPCSHISYPKVGHAPSKGTVGLHPVMKRWFAYGGNPAENSLAAVDWELKTISFFKEQL